MIELSSRTFSLRMLGAPVWTSLRCLFLVSFVRLSQNGVAQSITLTRGGSNPPDEYSEVFASRVLTINCSVSHPRSLKTVSWLRDSVHEMTRNTELKTNDRRVTVDESSSGNEYRVYSLHIANVTTADAGKYTCGVRWNNRAYIWGSVIVSVKYFPLEGPTCSASVSDTSPLNQMVRCDSEEGYPRVTITWTVESSTEEINATVLDYREETEDGRVKSELQLSQLSQPYLNLVCNVTSPTFPSLSKTCNISVFAPAAATMSDSTSASRQIRTEAKDSSGNTARLVTALAIPTVLVTCLVSVICLCVIKQKRQDRELRDWRDSPESNIAMDATKDGRGGSVIVPYSVTTLQLDARRGIAKSSQPFHETTHLGGEKMCKARLDVDGGSATGTEIPGQHPKFPDVPYYTVSVGDNDFLDPTYHGTVNGSFHMHYEHVNVGTAKDVPAMNVTNDAPTREAPYEVQVEVPGGSALNRKANCAGGDLEAPYYTTVAGDDDEHHSVCQEPHQSNTHNYYEHVITDIASSGVSVTNVASNTRNNPTARTGQLDATEFKHTKQNCVSNERSSEGMIDNPFYQPYDGKSPMINKGSVVDSVRKLDPQSPNNHAYLEIY